MSKRFNVASLAFAILIGLGSWSCYGGTATVAQLPNPADDDRPPGSPPELPRATVELPPAPTGPATRVVTDGSDLQGAIDDAKPGDVIAIQPGIVVRGPVTLPAKSGNGWIIIKTNAPDAAFPPPGTRVSPSDARLMPALESDGETAMKADAGAHHYRFIGIEIRPKSGAYIRNLVQFGFDTNKVEDLPQHIIFERCYVHGDPQVGSRRGIALNTGELAIVDSYFSDFKGEGEDTQAIAGWNGIGPFLIENNYLEAAGENIIFGGADPDVTNLVPSDITIRNNYLTKPVSWRTSQWTVKNLFELKNAHRVLVENNIIEHNWPQAQNGYAILITPRNQDGNSPWSMVRDVTFRGNVIRHVSSGVNIMGTDDINASQQTKRVVFRDNVFEDVNGPAWGGIGNLFQIFKGAADITIDHNTAFETNAVLVATEEPNTGFRFTNNIVANGVYGVGGDNYYGNSPQALSTYFPGSVFQGNVIQGGFARDYPPDNFFPAAMNDVGFANYDAGDYRLGPTSPFKNRGTDGKDPGADRSTADATPRHRAVRGH